VTVGLIYHDVVEERRRDEVGFPGPLAARYKLAPRRFEAHLDQIAAARARVGLVEPDGPLPDVALTFDDGGASALAAADAVERRGWRAHFFVTTARIGTPGFITADGIRELVRRGHAVGSHSHTHPTYMGRLPRAKIDEEWSLSRAILTEVLGAPPPFASVPGGFLSRDVVNGAAEAGFRVLMTSEPTVSVHHGGGLLVIGRFTIWASSRVECTGAYVRGAWGPRWRMRLAWNAKTLLKRASPDAYESLRRIVASPRGTP